MRYGIGSSLSPQRFGLLWLSIAATVGSVIVISVVEVRLPRHGVTSFGAGPPAELPDPGEWLWIADRDASAAPADLPEQGSWQGER